MKEEKRKRERRRVYSQREPEGPRTLSKSTDPEERTIRDTMQAWKRGTSGGVQEKPARQERAKEEAVERGRDSPEDRWRTHSIAAA